MLFTVGLLLGGCQSILVVLITTDKGTAGYNLDWRESLRDERTYIHLSRRVVDPIHPHQKPNAPAIAAIKACHQNNRSRAAFIERR